MAGRDRDPRSAQPRRSIRRSGCRATNSPSWSRSVLDRDVGRADARRDRSRSPPSAASPCAQKGQRVGRNPKTGAGSADQAAPGSGVPRLPCAEESHQRALPRERRRHRARPSLEPESPGAASGGRPARQVEKSASAFRTISEVADELDVPQHVLRFWETQVRPGEAAEARRRPALLPARGRRAAAPDPQPALRRRLHDQGRAAADARRRARRNGSRPWKAMPSTSAS